MGKFKHIIRKQMTKIDHTALYVCNLEAAKNFFVRFFGAHANNLYHNPKTGLSSYFLSFEDDTRLEIINCPEVLPTEKELYSSGYAHIAFSVGGKENVDKLTHLLNEAGYQTLIGPRTTDDGYYESCISDPEGNRIEITE